MNITYRQLTEAKPVIEGLLSLSPAPTARLAAQIARNARKAQQALRDFDTAHQTMKQAYADADGAFDYDQLSPERRAEIDAEFTELLDTEIEVDIHPLKIAEIEEVESKRPGFAIPVSTFFVADFMFVE